MTIFLQYILKLSIALGFTWLFYQVFLRRLTFYTWNRVYLLLYSLISFLLPFVNVGLFVENTSLEGHTLIQVVPVIEDLASANREISAGNAWISVLWITGCSLLIARLIIQQLSFLRLKSSATLLSAGNVKLYQVDRNITPFSFGRSVFINPLKHSDEDLAKIIRHEFVHVKQRHWIDMVWCELLCILNWYNPFAWLIRNAIRQNLEFIADQHVVQNGVDKKQYQYLLLKVTGNSRYSIAANFNFTSLKKRIAMMNKMRSAKVHLVKFLFLLPVIAVLLLAFRNHIPQVKLEPFFSRESLVIDTIPVQPAKPSPLPKNIRSIDQDDDIVTVTLKDGTKEKYNLSRTDEKAAFEKKYGKMPEPPEPPEPPHAVTAPEPKPSPEARSMRIVNNKVTIVFENGKRQEYDLNKPGEKADFEKKYGKPPTPPRKPSPPTEPKVVTTITITGVETKVNAKAPTVAISDPVVTETVTAIPTVSTVIRIDDTELLAEISNSFTTDDLSALRKTLESKHYTFSVSNTEFSNGRLVALEGIISNGVSKSHFSAHDFGRIRIFKALFKDGKEGFNIHIQENK